MASHPSSFCTEAQSHESVGADRIYGSSFAPPFEHPQYRQTGHQENPIDHQQAANMRIDLNMTMHVPPSSWVSPQPPPPLIQLPRVMSIPGNHPHIRYQPPQRCHYAGYTIPIEPRLLIRPRFPEESEWRPVYPMPTSADHSAIEEEASAVGNDCFLYGGYQSDQHIPFVAPRLQASDNSDLESPVDSYSASSVTTSANEVSPGYPLEALESKKEPTRPENQPRRTKRGGRRSRHGGNSQTYQCPACYKQYCRKSTLKAHLRQHSGERPYICQVCGKSFSQAANLTAHRRVHTGEKPFSCPICCRPFSQSSSLVTHKRTHTGERPYGCSHCHKAFTDSSTLTKHLRTHTGYKPYQCSECQLSFSQSGNLNRHMKTHRNTEA